MKINNLSQKYFMFECFRGPNLPPIQPTSRPVMAQKMLAQSLEAEQNEGLSVSRFTQYRTYSLLGWIFYPPIYIPTVMILNSVENHVELEFNIKQLPHIPAISIFLFFLHSPQSKVYLSEERANHNLTLLNLLSGKQL